MVREYSAAINYEERADRSILQAIMQDFEKSMGAAGESRQAIVDMGRRAYLTGGREGEDMKQAFIELAAKKGKLEDLHSGFGSMYNGSEEFRKEIKKSFSSLGYTEQEIAGIFQEYSAESVRKFSAAYLGLSRNFLDDQHGRNLAGNSRSIDQRRLMALAALSESAKNTGHWEQVIAVKDIDSGNYYVMGERERREEVIGEAKKRGMRDFLKNVAPQVFQKRTHGTDGSQDYIVDHKAPQVGSFENEMFNRLLGGQNISELRQMQSRLVDELIGRYFDKQGNFIDEAAAEKLGFRGSRKGRGEVVGARSDMIADFKRLLHNNPLVVQGLYNLKFGHRVGERPAGGYPWEREYVEKPAADHLENYRKYIENAISFEEIRRVVNKYGIDAESSENLRTLLNIKGILQDVQYAAQKGVVPKEAVMGMAAKMDSVVAWDPRRISPERLQRINELGKRRAAIDRSLLAGGKKSKILDSSASVLLQEKELIENKIKFLSSSPAGYWAADTGDNKYETNAHKIERMISDLSTIDLKERIIRLVNNLISNRSITIEKALSLKDEEPNSFSKKQLESLVNDLMNIGKI